MILVCPTSFKGTLTAAAAARAMAAGARDACGSVDCVELPVSDGGPGLIDSLHGALGGAIHHVRVRDPLGRAVDARVLLVELEGETAAVVECADACGMHLLAAHELDPMRLGSHGVGELIAAAAARADTVVLGLGGSATVDGGAGMAAALGWRLLTTDARALGTGGASLLELDRIEPPPAAAPRPRRTVALSDVSSPLYGAHGAAAVFAPQKGASADDVLALDAGLRRLAEVVLRDAGTDVSALAGGGAAGGLGAAAVAFLDAELEPGSDRVLEIVGFDRLLARARLVVTGEGAWDAQSSLGKITGAVIERAGRAGVRVLLIAGHATGPVPAHVTLVTGRQSGESGESAGRTGPGTVLPGALLDRADLRRLSADAVARLAPEIGC